MKELCIFPNSCWCLVFAQLKQTLSQYELTAAALFNLGSILLLWSSQLTVLYPPVIIIFLQLRDLKVRELEDGYQSEGQNKIYNM